MKSVHKIYVGLLFTICFSLLCLEVKSSARSASHCSVLAEVINVGNEIKKTDKGGEFQGNFIDLKILMIEAEKFCPVPQGRIYRATDNNPGTFVVGQKIKSEIESASAMGPEGVVSWLQWEPIKREDGSTIRTKEGKIVDHLQSHEKAINH